MKKITLLLFSIFFLATVLQAQVANSTNWANFIFNNWSSFGLSGSAPAPADQPRMISYSYAACAWMFDIGPTCNLIYPTIWTNTGSLSPLIITNSTVDDGLPFNSLYYRWSSSPSMGGSMSSGNWIKYLGIPAAPTTTYKITSICTDWIKSVTNSANITVYPSQTPPSGVWTYPTNGQTYPYPSTISISYRVAYPNGNKLTAGEFYNGTTLIARKTGSSPWNYSWRNVPVGTYSLTTRIFYNNGVNNRTVDTSPITIYVTSTNNPQPTIAITSPINNASYTVGTTVPLIATVVANNNTIGWVNFYEISPITGLSYLIGQSTPYSTNYTYNWILPGSSSRFTGVKTIWAGLSYTTPSGGAATELPSTSITFFATNTAPTIVLSSPAANAYYTTPANVILTATVTPNDNGITNVVFYNGPTPISTNTSPFTYTWIGILAGTYPISAMLTYHDGVTAGRTKYSSTNTIYVTNNLPVIVLSPTNNSKFGASSTIQLSAVVTTNYNNVTNVSFFNGNTLLGSSTGIPYQYSWNNVAVGSWPVKALAYYAGTSVSSSINTLVVTNVVTQNPTIVLTTPTNGFRGTAPTTLALAATVSNPGSKTLNKVDFYDGINIVATDTSSPYTGTYFVQAGTYPLKARLTYDTTGIIDSSINTITITNPVPTIVLTTDASSYARPANIVMTAAVVPNNYTITDVKFYGDGNLLATKTTPSSPNTYTFTWSQNTAAYYTLTAALTYSGGTVTSDGKVISVYDINTTTFDVPIYLDGLGQPEQTRTVTLSTVDPTASYTLQLLVNHAAQYGSAAESGPKMRVSFNDNTNWIDIKRSTVTVLPYFGRPDRFGGLGGTYETMWIEVPIPINRLVTGNNKINKIHFRHTFNSYTNAAAVSKTRTLISIPALNIRNTSGGFLINTNTTMIEQNVLTGPDYLPTAAYSNDWNTGYSIATTQPTYNPAMAKMTNELTGKVYPTDMLTSCSGCHTRTLWDMSYYSFPRVGVIGAGKRFGLSDAQAEQVYAYVYNKRKTDANYYGYGKIWNPPYQPGPGLDAKHVREWPAGAGIGAVLNTDTEVLTELFGGTTISYNTITNAAYTKDAWNTRHQRINIPLPSIFDWYPMFYPQYAWFCGDYTSPSISFENSTLYKQYKGTVPSPSGIAGGVHGACAYFKSLNFQNQYMSMWYALSDGWMLPYYNYSEGTEKTVVSEWNKTMTNTGEKYCENITNTSSILGGKFCTSYANWFLIKWLELMVEYDFAAYTDNFYLGKSLESRQLIVFAPFDATPNINKNWGGDGFHSNTGVHDNTRRTAAYLTVAWYQLQIAVNPGRYVQPSSGVGSTGSGVLRTAIRPMDWPYAYGFFGSLAGETGHPMAGMLIQNQVKGWNAQDFTNGVIDQGHGWSPQRNSTLFWLLNNDVNGAWAGSDISSKRGEYIDCMLRYWLYKMGQFGNTTIYNMPAGDIASGVVGGYKTGGDNTWTSPRSGVIIPSGEYSGQFMLPEMVWGMINNSSSMPARINDGSATEAQKTTLRNWAKTVWPNGNF